jgi:hypothetical protein
MYPRKMLLSLFLILTAAACAGAMERTWTKVPALVLVTPENDARIQAAREAVDFWNHTFSEIGTPFRLGTMMPIIATVPAEVLQDLSARVVGRGAPVDFPESVQRLSGDMVLVLSDGDFVSFAARSSSSRKVLIGIRSDRLSPPSLTVKRLCCCRCIHYSGQVRNRRLNTMPRSMIQGGVASPHKRCFALRLSGTELAI